MQNRRFRVKETYNKFNYSFIFTKNDTKVDYLDKNSMILFRGAKSGFISSNNPNSIFQGNKFPSLIKPKIKKKRKKKFVPKPNLRNRNSNVSQ